MNNIYTVIDKWNLNNLDINILSDTELDKLINDIENAYNNAGMPKINGMHLSITDSVNIMENPKCDIRNITYPLLFSSQIWLPDPIYTAVAKLSSELWKKLPESGCNEITISIMNKKWWNLYDIQATERKEYLKLTISRFLPKLLQIRELVDLNYIYIYPWELILKNDFPRYAKTITELESHKEFIFSLTTQYMQSDYSLGIRLPSFSIQGMINNQLQNLYFKDQGQMLLLGLINANISNYLKSDLYENKKGDRLVHDYIRNGLSLSNNNPFIIQYSIPAFQEGLWENIVALKKDSELLFSLIEVIQKFSYGDPNNNQDLKDELLELSSKLSLSNSIKRLFTGESLQANLGLLGNTANNIITGSTVNAALTGAGVATGLGLLGTLFSEYIKGKKRRDIILSLAEKV
ncbi:hypothetical protein [Treponema sp.]|uniref:hypothetical protein n=1 Tax=Treponema sp. TaxID=166 RepID=UPI00257A1018|nr:hypothetical protein [Treponema sp.]